MRTPADVKDRAQVGTRLRLQFCDGYHRDFNRTLAIIAVSSEGVTLEGGTVVKWSCSMAVQSDGFTLFENGKPHLQYVFEKDHHEQANKSTRKSA